MEQIIPEIDDGMIALAATNQMEKIASIIPYLIYREQSAKMYFAKQSGDNQKKLALESIKNCNRNIKLILGLH